MKKYLLTLLILHSSLFILKAQGTWSPRASLPDSVRGYGVGFSIGKYGYVGLGGSELSGNNWKYFTDFWQFDPSTNSWTRKAAFPGKARICPATFVIGNYAYVLCGAQNNEGYDLQTECWQYNSVTDQWKQKHDFPGISRCCAAGFAIGKNGYLGTGYDTLPTIVLKDFWEYDTATDTWTQKHDFGGAARYGASGFSVKGYICFGLDSTNSIAARDMWEYDTATDSWIRKSNNPKDSMGFTNGFVIGDNIFVGTGQSQNFKVYSDFWKYNTTNDTWTQQENFLGGTAALCSAFAINDTGYMGLGVQEDNTLRGSNTFFRFLPDSITGINEIIDSWDYISVYPNPTSSVLFINFNKQIIGLATLSIMDVTGREVVSEQLSVVSDQTSVNVSSLATGMYFINLKTKDLYVTRKFIKQ